MHDGFGFGLLERTADFLPARKIAADERRALVNRATMTFRQIVEDNDIVAFIEQELDANAPDVSRSADDKDFHPRKVRRTLPLSKESPLERPEVRRSRSLERARIMRRTPGIFPARREHLEAFFRRAPFENVDIDRAHAPFPHCQPVRLVKVDRAVPMRALP